MGTPEPYRVAQLGLGQSGPDNFIKEESLKKPNVNGVGTFQSELIFEAAKKCTPVMTEVPPNFHPQPLNTCIMGRTRCGM